MNPHAGVKVYVANRQRRLRVPAARIRQAAEAAAAFGGLEGILSVVVVGDRKMRRLNRRFASADGTTDVLAFDLGADVDPKGPTGEVIVNASVALEEAERRGKGAEGELLLYVVHGVLHLGGLRDATPGEIRCMRSAERTLMRRLSAPQGEPKTGGGGKND